MDKEQLLAYYQSHYLSRQEVLYKLPLNYSIETFWPELLNRRKAKSTLLPLYDSSGMPYWYVLTDGMIAASERLCEEAMQQDGNFDPYRMEMTSAMTQEMFFTSFVEGAQIPLKEAMDFLARGTEPESIQEQMIWNNRHAWSEMVNGLYRPIDEELVKSLAFMLTEEMDRCASDYRDSNEHEIAAMNGERYEVPAAFIIAERMSQYYTFMQSPEVHPLIKAAAAQAYLLVARPFPEGNERLSRMMSSAVLLRCGYDFFRDISISAVIARESYRYYKAMREILRSENGGDLTYFIEYYLELLVRALDLHKERLRKREQENLERERQMALTPLGTTGEKETSEKVGATVYAQVTKKSEHIADDHIEERTGMGLLNAGFDLKLKIMTQRKSIAVSRGARALQKFISEGKNRFTSIELAKAAEITEEQARYACSSFKRVFLIRSISQERPMIYAPDYDLGMKSIHLTRLQTEYTIRLYKAFSDREFTVESGLEIIPGKHTTLLCHLKKLVMRGILNYRIGSGSAGAYIFSFAVTPEDNPEYFMMQEEETAVISA